MHIQHQTQGKAPAGTKQATGSTAGSATEEDQGEYPKQQTKSAASDAHLESLPELYLLDLHHNVPVISEPVPITSIAVGLLIQH